MTEANLENSHSTAAPRRASVLAADQLRSIVERLERLNEEKDGIASDIKDLFAESKGNGFCTKTLKTILKLRTMDASERDEAEYLLDSYCVALGMKPQMEMFDELPAPEGLAVNPSDDEVEYLKAKDIVLRDRKASTSYVQRMLQIGYNRAAGFIDRMEEEGIVSSANHVGKREVLG